MPIREHFTETRLYYSCHNPKVPEEASWGSFKRKRSFRWRILSPPPRITDRSRKPVMISHYWPSEEEVRALEEGALHRRHPEEYPHTLLMLLSTRKEFPSAKQQLLTRVRTPRHKRRWWNQIHLHDRPGLSPLLPQTHHQERRSSSTKMRTGLIRSEIRQTNCQSRTLFILPNSSLVTKTNISWQAHHEDWWFAPTRLLNCKSPTIVSTISIFSLSFLHQTKKKNDMATPRSREVWRKKFCQRRQMWFSLQGSTLFIDGGRGIQSSSIQTSNPKEPVHISRFSADQINRRSTVTALVWKPILSYYGVRIRKGNGYRIRSNSVNWCANCQPITQCPDKSRRSTFMV